MAYCASWFLLLRSMPLRPVRSTKRASLSLNWHTWSKTMDGTNTLTHTIHTPTITHVFTPHSSGKTHTSSSSPSHCAVVFVSSPAIHASVHVYFVV